MQALHDIPGTRVVADADTLWGEPDSFDAVIVASGTAAHVRHALAAVAAGKPVIVEKPIAPSADEAQRLAAAASSAGVIVVPFHNRRWDSDLLTLQRLLREGVLGEVLRFESRFDRWRPESRRDSWRERLASEDGGGVLLDLGVHLVDQALLLWGPVEHVDAEMFSRRGGADDDVFIALHHRSGVTSHLAANALAAEPGPRLRVLGRRGAFVVDSVDGQEEALTAGRSAADPDFGVEPEGRWGRFSNGTTIERVPAERGAWIRFFEAFRASVFGEGDPPVALADAVEGLAVLDAARRSAATGAAMLGPHH